MSTQQQKARPEFEPTPAEKGAALETAKGELVPHAGKPAYLDYSAEMVALAGKTIMPKNYELPELYFAMQVAATYGLDLFLREMWCIRMSDNASEPVTFLVGIDGLQKIAERHPDYRGFRNLEVHAKDEFRYLAVPRAMPDGSHSHVEHGFDVTADRGELLGAYAEVYREGRPPMFFWAPLEEYVKTSGRSPWLKQKTAMIRKCALANALRRTFRISGLYIADELSSQTLARNASRGAEAAEPVAHDLRALVADPWTAERLGDLFRALNDAEPGSYLPAKQRLLVQAKDDEELAALVAELERELLDRGLAPPPPPDPAELADVALEGELVEEDEIGFAAPATDPDREAADQVRDDEGEGEQPKLL